MLLKIVIYKKDNLPIFRDVPKIKSVPFSTQSKEHNSKCPLILFWSPTSVGFIKIGVFL